MCEVASAVACLSLHLVVSSCKFLDKADIQDDGKASMVHVLPYNDKGAPHFVTCHYLIFFPIL